MAARSGSALTPRPGGLAYGCCTTAVWRAACRGRKDHMRICSLLPSATDIVLALGLGDRLVAVTHECDLPPELREVPIVTRSRVDPAQSSSREIHDHVTAAAHSGSSLYTLDHARLERLDPDLILTQELCDVCAISYQEVASAVRRLQVALPGHRTGLSLAHPTLAR